MNISKIVRSAKCGVLSALVAMGMTAVAEPTVTVNKVESGEPWSKITVNYTLGGTDAKLDYKVAFDVTAKDQTASVTNDAAKLTDGAATKEIDTLALFGKQVVDTKAKVKVTLIAIKPKATGVQLWANGPFWAETNLGESEVAEHPEYGAFYKFEDADAAVKSLLGQEWRVPSKEDFEKLVNGSYCTRKWDSTRNGYTFTGATDGYTDKSIFLPLAGYDWGYGRDSAWGENEHGEQRGEGIYCSSDAYNDNSFYTLNLEKMIMGPMNEERAEVPWSTSRAYSFSVRAVR